ncbi:M50 family metallopeptidase, partial [bacterium]|nr:M50 family metallopeptidase [bacterium]
ILNIFLTSDEGGLCRTIGGIYWIILSAGYLGSLLWGSAILLVATMTNYDKTVVKTIGIVLISVTLLYIRSAAGFSFGLLFGIGLIAFAQNFSTYACDVLLRYIGLTSSFYVILDIKSDLLDRNVPDSDASKLAEMLHLPSQLVGGAWFFFALFITWKVLRSTVSGK